MDTTDIVSLTDLLVLEDDEQCEAELQEALRMLGDSPTLRDVWLVGYARGAGRVINHPDAYTLAEGYATCSECGDVVTDLDGRPVKLDPYEFYSNRGKICLDCKR